MNCQNAREQITDTLAGGSAELTGELTAHVETCAGCGAFYVQQAELFRAVDSGVSAMANEPVPASLLPRVRARMEERIPRRSWVSSALTAAAALAVVVLVAIFHPLVEKKPKGMPVSAIPALSKDNPEVHQHTGIVTAVAALPRGPKVIHAEASRGTCAEGIAAVPEVIVLRQEREAFARFLAELPKEKEIAEALTQAAPQKDEQPVETALLQIGELEVRPLDPAAPDQDLN